MALRLRDEFAAFKSLQRRELPFHHAKKPLKLANLRVYNSIDKATQKVEELREKTPIDIQANFSMTGIEEFEEAKERVIGIQREIVLDKLEGDARRIQSTKFELEDALNSLTKKKEANEEYYKHRLALIKKDYEDAMALYKAHYEELSEAEKKEVDEKIARAQKLYEERMVIENKRYEEMVAIYKTEKEVTVQQSAEIIGVLQSRLEADGKMTKAVIDNAGARTNAADKELNKYKQLRDEYSKPLPTPSAPAAPAASTKASTSTKKKSGGTFSISGPTPNVDWSAGLQGLLSKYSASVLRSGMIGMPLSNFAQWSEEDRNRLKDIVGSKIWDWWAKTGGSTLMGTNISGFRAAQAGMEYVPRTGMYRLHRGERVTPAEEARRGGVITIINKIGEDLITEMLDPDVIINIISADIIRNGITRRVIRGAVG